MSAEPDIAKIQSGGASAHSDQPLGRPVHRETPPPPAKRPGPSTVAQRARIDIAEMARETGLVCDVEPSRSISCPHVHLRTKKVKVFGKVKVMRSKFQVREHLAETMSFARLEGAIPVVWHKRPDMPTLAVLPAADFFAILAKLEGVSK